MKRLPAIAFSVLAGFSLASILGVNHGPAQAGPSTSNGDVNGDGDIDIADAIYTLMHLFKGGPAPVACARSPDLEARVAALEQEIAASREVLSHISLREETAGSYQRCHEEFAANCDPPTESAKTIRFDGVNVQIVNGTGSTYELNGLGNLIVGYQEDRNCGACEEGTCWESSTNTRYGSHNLVVGSRNNYRSATAVVVGNGNGSWGFSACVLGGGGNIAIGARSVVLGGTENVAINPSSGIVAGFRNIVGEDNAVLLGGRDQRVGDTENQLCDGE